MPRDSFGWQVAKPNRNCSFTNFEALQNILPSECVSSILPLFDQCCRSILLLDDCDFLVVVVLSLLFVICCLCCPASFVPVIGVCWLVVDCVFVKLVLNLFFSA